MNICGCLTFHLRQYLKSISRISRWWFILCSLHFCNKAPWFVETCGYSYIRYWLVFLYQNIYWCFKGALWSFGKEIQTQILRVYDMYSHKLFWRGGRVRHINKVNMKLCFKVSLFIQFFKHKHPSLLIKCLPQNYTLLLYIKIVRILSIFPPSPTKTVV